MRWIWKLAPSFTKLLAIRLLLFRSVFNLEFEGKKKKHVLFLISAVYTIMFNVYFSKTNLNYNWHRTGHKWKRSRCEIVCLRFIHRFFFPSETGWQPVANWNRCEGSNPLSFSIDNEKWVYSPLCIFPALQLTVVHFEELDRRHSIYRRFRGPICIRSENTLDFYGMYVWHEMIVWWINSIRLLKLMKFDVFCNKISFCYYETNEKKKLKQCN